MPLPIFQRTVVNDQGQILPNATVEVRNEIDSELVTLYQDEGGTVPLSNPFATGEDGLAVFYADPAKVRIEATANSGSIEWRNVVLIDTLAFSFVEDNFAEVNTVADNIADINSVAGDLAAINTAATNIQAIIDAPQAATDAETFKNQAGASAVNALASEQQAATIVAQVDVKKYNNLFNRSRDVGEIVSVTVPPTSTRNGGVFAPNGKMYMIPNTVPASAMLTIDADTGDTATFGSFSGGYSGGVIAPNGKMYCAPWNSASCLVINTNNNTSSTIAAFFGPGGNYGGMVLSNNGAKVVAVPYSATNIRVINTSDDTAENTVTSLSGSAKWFGGVLDHKTNKVYFIPHLSNTIDVYDIDAETLTTGSASIGGSVLRCAGGVLAPNGKIYCAPYDLAQILIIDTSDDSFELVGSFAGSAKWQGAYLGADGRVYFAPRNSTSVLAIDTSTHTTELIDVSSVKSTTWRGAVMHPSGVMYFCDTDGTATAFYGMGTGMQQLPTYAYGAYNNHL